MMTSDPYQFPAGPPPLPHRVPHVFVLDLAAQLLAESPVARVKLLVEGREVYAKGIIKIDPRGDVVIC